MNPNATSALDNLPPSALSPENMRRMIVDPKKILTLSEQVRSVSDLLEAPETPTQWLIEGLWPAEARGLVAGVPGIGKTWWTMSAGLSVVTGQPFLGHFPIHGPGGVLLVEEESSKANLQRRFIALSKGQPGLNPSDLKRFLYLVRTFAKITDPKTQKELIKIIEGEGIRLAIFDSFRRFHNGDENSSKELIPALEGFARIQVETGAAVLLIHHFSKSGSDKRPVFERLRGSSDIWAWRDAVVALDGEEGSDQVTCTIQLRDEESPTPFIVVREVLPTGGVILKYENLGEREDIQEIVQAIEVELKGDPVRSKRALVGRIKGFRRQDIFTALKSMESKGQVEMREGFLCVI